MADKLNSTLFYVLYSFQCAISSCGSRTDVTKGEHSIVTPSHKV